MSHPLRLCVKNHEKLLQQLFLTSHYRFTVTEELNGNNITSVLLVNSSNFQQDDGIYTCQASQNNILKQSEDVGIFQGMLALMDECYIRFM